MSADSDKSCIPGPLRSEGFGGRLRKAEEEHLGGVLTCAAGKGCGPWGTSVLCPQSEASKASVDW